MRYGPLRFPVVCCAIACCWPGFFAHAALTIASPTDPAAACLPAIQAAERAHLTPPGLLAAIGLVESGRRDPIDGTLAPWPWTIDVDGDGHVYPTESQAVAAVRQAQAEGHRSIDVGCMQINLQQHPEAFTTLETAFDPASNANYAASFLRRLHDAAGDWMIAAGQYHSLTQALAAPYRARVMAMLQPGTAETLLAAAAPPPIGPAGFSPFGGGRFLLHGGLPAAPGGGAGSGRALAAYRAAPVPLARRTNRIG